MGACLSCLGISQPQSSDEPSENDRLLYSPTPAAQYGATAPAADPEALQRQRAALERICASAADDLLDASGSGERLTPSHRAALLNARFAPIPETANGHDAKSDKEEDNSTPRAPRTPVAPSLEPAEPPSPFTRAQMAARGGAGTAERTVGTIREGTPDDDEDEEAAEEQAWLARMGEQQRWDEVKKPGESLVISLEEEAK